MAYGVKVGIKAKDIYDRLTPAEKERFEEIIISDVDKTEDEVIITAIAIENIIMMKINIRNLRKRNLGLCKTLEK